MTTRPNTGTHAPLRRIAVLLALGLAMGSHAASTPARRTWAVEGVVREALVCEPARASTNPVPVVFVFHGHGGSMNQALRSFALHEEWPEALVVYPQGLKTPGRLTDPEGRRAGWQHGAGEQDDRDLKFFDAMLEGLRRDHRLDDRRVYATGHSNGGIFTYLLWADRGAVLAAVAPSGSVAADNRSRLQPKPVLHIAGEKDPLVKFSWQQLNIAALRRLNRTGDPLPPDGPLTVYPSTNGTPVITFIHPGGHEFPRAAVATIVKFFRAQTLPPPVADRADSR